MREPDVEISASVQADELVFREAPDVEERAAAEPAGESGARTERHGLERPVRSNTTYRNVRVSHRLSARLADPEE